MDKTNQELYDLTVEGFNKSLSETRYVSQKIVSAAESVDKTLSETKVSIRLLESISSKLDNIDRRINSMELNIAALKLKIR